MGLRKTYTLPIPQSALNVADKPNTIVLVGPAGSGKTTQIWTLPKPCLVIAFDGNCSESIRGCPGVDFVEFAADNVPLAPKTGKHTVKGSVKPDSPQAYLEFWQFLTEAKATGYFDSYASIVVDSMTSLEKIVEDVILYDIGKSDSVLEREEYSYLTKTVQCAIREIATIVTKATPGTSPRNLVLLAHRTDRYDRSAQIIGVQMAVVGKLRQFIPTLVSHVFYLDQAGDSRKSKYLAQTRGNSWIADARSSFQGLPFSIDMTVGDFSSPEQYGLGKLISCIETDHPWS